MEEIDLIENSQYVSGKYINQDIIFSSELI